MQFFHRLVALGTKVLRKWEGPVWDHEPTSVVRLLTPDAVVEKIAYVLANPVAAGLVEQAHEWPGAKVLVDELGGGVLRVKRPDVYFAPTNPQWPEEATLELKLPPGVAQDAADGFRQKVGAELERQQGQARGEVQQKSFGVLGAERASTVSPYDRATSFEPLRARNPTFAVGRGGRRLRSLPPPTTVRSPPTTVRSPHPKASEIGSGSGERERESLLKLLAGGTRIRRS